MKKRDTRIQAQKLEDKVRIDRELSDTATTYGPVFQSVKIKGNGEGKERKGDIDERQDEGSKGDRE